MLETKIIFQMLPHIPYHPLNGCQEFLVERWQEPKRFLVVLVHIY